MIFFEDARSRIVQLERFVNCCGFNLASPADMGTSLDPSWKHSTPDFLYALQERFWSQIVSLRPISYISSGDNDIVVTRNASFARKVHELVSRA